MNTNKPGRARRVTAVVGGLVGLAILVPALPAAAHVPTEGPPAPPASFADLSTAELWKLIDGGGDRAIVGLKDDDEAVGFLNGRTQLDAAERVEATAAIRTLKGVTVVRGDEVLPTVTVKVDGVAALTALRNSRNVEFVEPARLYGEVLDGLGCTGNAGNGNPAGGTTYTEPYGYDDQPILHEGDYMGPYGDTTPDGDLVPYNFKFSNIRKAWGRSPAGAGVTVAVVDTGIFSTQTQLKSASVGGHFSSGESAGRTLTVYDSTGYPFEYQGVDFCNHGTRSAGTVAGPRDGTGMVGVAYRANLRNVKVDDDVTIGQWNAEADRVAEGICNAASVGAKVISIAMGTHIEYTSVRQAVDCAYDRGALVVAAAGTGPIVCSVPFTGERMPVMWPARRSNVMAVTALQANGQRHPEACDGPEVDIAAVVAGASAPGRNPDDKLSWGGTSAATGLVSGVAALIWSQHPNWTRQEVWDRLIWARTTPTGPVDAYKAVGGLHGMSIAAPVTVSPGASFTLTAQPQGEGPFTYLWSNGATTPQTTATGGAGGTTQTFSVTVRDTVDGRVLPYSVQVDSFGNPPPEPICRNPRFC